MGIVAWYSQHALVELEGENKPVLSLIQSVTMIRNLQFDYLVSQEKRSLDQWDIIYNIALNQSSEIHSKDASSKARVERIKRSLTTLKKLFNSAVVTSPANLTGVSSNQHDKFSLSYHILNQQSLNAIDELSQMESEIKTEEERIRQQIDLITLLTFTIIPFITILSLLFLYLRLDKSLSRLEEGTKILGSGDLHHRIEIKGNDEFVNLAHSINQMIEDLQKVLISRDLLMEEKHKAEVANQSKSIFLANISHELRTPLNAILGFSLLLRQDPTLSPSQISQLEIINKSGEHLLMIINDVLDMAKIEAGRITTNIHPFDLHRLINALYHLFSLQASEKGLSYHLNLPSDIPQYISSDEGKIRQILINLISNAIKFTDKGTVSIEVRTQSKARDIHRMEISEYIVSDFLIVRVIDTGIGISPADRQFIFEPFEQTTQSKQRPGGTGLGLSISKKYTGLLGGSLTVESTGIPDAGTTFILTLPFSPAFEESIRAQSPEKSHYIVADNIQDLRILIVDDWMENRELLAAFHKAFGISTVQVSSGKEAIEYSRRWHPQLIWMDVFMPGMNGDEAMRQIRRSEGEKTPVIIAVTASAFDEQRRYYLEQGFDGYLAKPYTEEDVIYILETYLHIEFISHAHDTEKWQEDGAILDPPPDMSTIDSYLLDNLMESAERGNVTQIYSGIGKIREQDPAIADLLKKYADSFDYERILAFLKERTR